MLKLSEGRKRVVEFAQYDCTTLGRSKGQDQIYCHLVSGKETWRDYGFRILKCTNAKS